MVKARELLPSHGCLRFMVGHTLLRSRGGAFNFRHYPTCRGDTVRAFAAIRGSAEIVVALSLGAGACVRDWFDHPAPHAPSLS